MTFPRAELMPFVVQYRGKELDTSPQPWTDMAAFDAQGAAVNYAKQCGFDGCPWEYQVVERRSNPPAEQGGVPRTLSEFVNAPDSVRERVGEEVIDKAIERQNEHTKAAPQEPDLRGRRVSATTIPAGAAPDQKARAGDLVSNDDTVEMAIRNAARDIRAALRREAERTRPGWQWVPVEPAMGQWDDFCSIHKVPFDTFIAAYKAMLAAPADREDSNG